MLRKLLLLAFIVCCTISVSSQQSQPDQKVVEAIEKQGESFLKNKEIRSLSLGVYYKGQMYIQHFGTLGPEQNYPPNDNSIYEIASVTKTMTAYLVANAVLDNRLNLETDIREYLPGEFPNLEYEGQPILVKHLLTHTAGLPHFLPEELDGIFERLTPEVPQEFEQVEVAVTKEDFFQSLKSIELKEKPGSGYYYSNAGSELLGFILEEVYQGSLDELYEQHLFTKAEMTDSAIEMNEDQLQRAVQGFWMNNENPSPYFANTLWAAGAGVKSTPADIMKYVRYLLEANDPVITEMQKELYHDGRTRWLGYQWNMWKDKYGTSFNHHGGSAGMQNWLYLFPDQELGISIFTNHSGPKTPGKLNKVVVKLLKAILK